MLLLLRIPALYYSRVHRIVQYAQLSNPEIERMALASAEQWDSQHPTGLRQFTSLSWSSTNATLPQSLINFRSTWERFIGSLLHEWKTLNIISVLLLSAIPTMHQIDTAANLITRTSALFSLICALMSLLYGCIYIIRFGAMTRMHKASKFAKEAQKDTTSIWWNVWVSLAMRDCGSPFSNVALRSILMFFMSIMSFIWLSGTVDDPVGFKVSSRAALGPCVGLTVIFALGLMYFAFIVKTFHRYGDVLDEEWMRTADRRTQSSSCYVARQTNPLALPVANVGQRQVRFKKRAKRDRYRAQAPSTSTA
ncbi:hypothetical protein B0H10DRAFT_2386940 [Mycena sp. CBHHK59/15]|nr:hypothetical protein B0H10DRAFT_2386940 [Mycena sp. CBHHK59/15]